MKQTLMIITLVAIVSGLIYLNLSNTIDPHTPDVALPHKATSAKIAVTNHQSSLAKIWDDVDSGAAEIIHLTRVFEMAMTSARILGDTSVYERLGQTIAKAQAAHPNNQVVQSVATRFKLATHQYSQADRRNLAPQDQATLDWALTGSTANLVTTRQEVATATPSVANYVLLADALIQNNRYEEADAAYGKALDSFRDTSPFTLAWIYFLRGVLHGEKLEEPNLALAQKYYEYAVAYIPEYAQARVHLSEVYSENGDLKLAIGTLLPVADSLEPEVQGALAGYYKELGDDHQASQYKVTATNRYNELLETFQLAFADHGAEFFSGAGQDPARAFTLAEINHRNRPSGESFATLVEMARAVNKVEQVCGDQALRNRLDNRAASACMAF